MWGGMRLQTSVAGGLRASVRPIQKSADKICRYTCRLSDPIWSAIISPYLHVCQSAPICRYGLLSADIMNYLQVKVLICRLMLHIHSIRLNLVVMDLQIICRYSIISADIQHICRLMWKSADYLLLPIICFIGSADYRNLQIWKNPLSVIN